MITEQEQYLQSLLHWSKEVEMKVKTTHMSEENEKKWLDQLEKWRSTIKKALKQNNITESEVQKIQQEGQTLLYSLADYYEEERKKKVVGVGEHTLPPLPYAYDALEPYISKEIMKLHHDIHHQSYVTGLNKAEKKLEQLRRESNQDQSLLKHWLREQAFHGSGHFLHTMFWFNMTPRGEGKPTGELLRQIERDFGSFRAFKKQFSEAALSVEGVGWAIVVWELRSGRLAIQTAEKHQMFALWDVVPLLALDVWEHAYYLQYQTKRQDYVNNWWNIVNWSNVQERYDKVKDIKWTLY
ncbi:superoxide dismutase [Pontibacillus salicampi]|uniref:superoxide dismutase n=1 Tax=Pontibacillus salicampi TaxID=1449801 RepID=A0ABV6LL22_9BACI